MVVCRRVAYKVHDQRRRLDIGVIAADTYDTLNRLLSTPLITISLLILKLFCDFFAPAQDILPELENLLECLDIVIYPIVKIADHIQAAKKTKNLIDFPTSSLRGRVQMQAGPREST